MIQAEVMATPQALRLEPSRPYQALHVVCETKVMGASRLLALVTGEWSSLNSQGGLEEAEDS